MEYGNGNHLLSRITDNRRQQHVDRVHTGYGNRSQGAKIFSEERGSQQRNHLSKDIRQQGYRPQLRGQLQAERRFLEPGDEYRRQGVISKTTPHSQTFGKAPTAQNKSGQTRKKQGSRNGRHRNQQHFEAQTPYQLFELPVATDADADLQQQRIEHIHRDVVHVDRNVTEDAHQTADTEKCHYNQTTFHHRLLS